MATKIDRSSYRILLRTNATSWSGTDNYLHLRAWVVKDVGDDVRHFSSSAYSDEEDLALADLGIRAQMDTSGDHGWYHYQVAYHEVNEVHLNKATAMAKTLRSITAKMDKLGERFGRPTDVMQQLAYLANAVGIPADQPFMFASTSSWRADGLREADLNSTRYWLDEQIKTWRKSLGLEVS